MTINLKNLLNPKGKLSKMGEFQELKSIEGLQISAVSADLYGDGRDDLTLFFFEEGANFGAVYTNSNDMKPLLSPANSPESINGFKNMIYPMVAKVVKPATISVLILVLYFLNSKVFDKYFCIFSPLF